LSTKGKNPVLAVAEEAPEICIARHSELEMDIHKLVEDSECIETVKLVNERIVGSTPSRNVYIVGVKEGREEGTKKGFRL
jgi:hypothetical protein